VSQVDVITRSDGHSPSLLRFLSLWQIPFAKGHATREVLASSRHSARISSLASPFTYSRTIRVRAVSQDFRVWAFFELFVLFFEQYFIGIGQGLVCAIRV
jgi:hypothetical protein